MSFKEFCKKLGLNEVPTVVADNAHFIRGDVVVSYDIDKKNRSATVLKTKQHADGTQEVVEHYFIKID